MNRRFKDIKVFQKSKNELYVSILVVVFGALFFMSNMRYNFYDFIKWVVALLVGFLCALNAVLDHKRMNSVERIASVVWLCIVSVLLLSESIYAANSNVRYGGY